MSTPTFDDVLKALIVLEDAVNAEKVAHQATVKAADDFNTVLSDFLGRKPGMTAEQVSAVRTQLEAHAVSLEGLTNPSRPLAPSKESAVAGPLDDVIARIDADTTALATVVKDLRDKLSTSMSPAEVDAAKATLSAVADRLEATATDPNNPVPPGPPPPLVNIKKKTP